MQRASRPHSKSSLGDRGTLSWRVTVLLLGGILTLHLALAERSLIVENPTVDEVMHLPAGVTYWQKKTFRLYHHNPPLVKLIAALPVVLSDPVMAPVYQQASWTAPEPSPPTFSQTFARFNTDRYFELFRLARMTMPLFSVLGGLVVFLWSHQLYGRAGGLLSLSLWCFCPNILAHSRLVTTDLGATAMGVLATYGFWLYLRRPSWLRATGAGVVLGLAQLSKFSMLLLYAVWPFLWIVETVATRERTVVLRHATRGLAHGLFIVVLSILTIDSGYLFEGVGIPLGRFEFASGALTRPVAQGIRTAPASRNELYARLWPFRQNRFRGTMLERLPSPLPEHYLLGFDEQKVESEGLPERLVRASEALLANDVKRARRELDSADIGVLGYPVYLNGVVRDSGWWYYYLCTLCYKVPEGIWLLVILSFLLLVRRRSWEAWADEICLGTVPVVVLFTMSLLTDINLGLRYVLPIAPYVFIAAGKVVPWVTDLTPRFRRLGQAMVAGCLGLTLAATLWIYPHYLAYFNWISGGPDRVPPRLIDSNLDWGQDLIGLRQWCRDHAPGQPIGLAYFGQINPTIFAYRGDPLDWFLPPAAPGTMRPIMEDSSDHAPPLIGPARRLVPGYYAVSASLVSGLRWRLYDSSPLAWESAWRAENDAFGYFRKFTPVARIGHSIYVYKLSREDILSASM
ncbi:MAG: ArnT family glycosyltransferase [Isosphaeraceae bacterium]